MEDRLFEFHLVDQVQRPGKLTFGPTFKPAADLATRSQVGCYEFDRARRKRTARHGGKQERVDFQEAELAAPSDDDQLLAVNDALDKPAAQHKEEAELVKLRCFVGRTNEEAAEVLGISVRTAKYYWTHARAWLYREIEPEAQ